MQKTPYVFPIIGMRKVEQLHANIEALDIALTEDHIKKIEAAVPFVKGSPYDLFVRNNVSLQQSSAHDFLFRVMATRMGSSRPFLTLGR